MVYPCLYLILVVMVKKTGYPIFSTTDQGSDRIDWVSVLMDQSYKGDWFIRLDGNLITPRINPFTPLIRCTKYRAESLQKIRCFLKSVVLNDMILKTLIQTRGTTKNENTLFTNPNSNNHHHPS